MAQQGNKKSGITIWQLVRWTFLSIAILVVVLMLKKPAPLPLGTRTPQELGKAAGSFDSKVADLEQAHVRGEAGVAVKLTEDELNGALQRSTGQLPPIPPGETTGGSGGTATQPSAPPAGGDPQNVPVKSSQVSMVGDEVVAQFVTEQLGKDVYVTLSARLGAENGHLVIHPTNFKMGDLSVPISMVDDIVQRKLNEPENAEKLKLPDYVKDVRVENGQLVIEEK